MANITQINVNGTTYNIKDASAGNVSHDDSASAGSATPINADQLQGHPASYFQQALVSGTNIKTIGGESILGSGDVYIPYKAVNTCNLTLTHAVNGGTCTLTGTINGGSIASTTLTGTATFCNLSTDFSLFVNGNRYLTTVNITNSKAILACGDKYTEYTFPNNSSYAWTVTLS